MAPTPNLHYLPNGQVLTVLPVFGGFYFKANDLNTHSNVFPAGWTVIIQSEDYSDDHNSEVEAPELEGMPKTKRRYIHPFKQPTLQNDNLFISSISNPSSNEFKAPTSPTRQIAMMLWATLNWYFHLPPPALETTTDASGKTPLSARPKGEWRLNVKREGVFRGRNLIQKLERMGLLACEESSVGLPPEENTPEGWTEMFISRRTFWQLSAKLFLFTLTPAKGSAFPATPYGSRPSSPFEEREIRLIAPRSALVRPLIPILGRSLQGAIYQHITHLLPFSILCLRVFAIQYDQNLPVKEKHFTGVTFRVLDNIFHFVLLPYPPTPSSIQGQVALPRVLPLETRHLYHHFLPA